LAASQSMRSGALPLSFLLLLSAAPLASAQIPHEQTGPVDQAAQTSARSTNVARDPLIADARYGLFNEPSFITKGVTVFNRRALRWREPKDGWYVDMGNMITGAGFLSAGPGYRKHVLGDNAIVSASTALSVHLYSMAQASIEF